MSGKAVLVLVVGVIIITSTIMFNIEASSTRIVRNFSEYYVRQATQNLAQSGVNLALTKLEEDVKWRDGISNLKTMDGTVSVRVYDAIFDSTAAIAIESIAETYFSAALKRRDTSLVTVNRGGWRPKPLKGLLTLNASTGINGNIDIDGRNHDMSGNLLAGSGIPGVWSTKPTFNISGSGRVGGTTGGTDYAPANPPDPGALVLNTPYPEGYPTTPDEVMTVWSQNFTNGTLKAIAQSGFMGSQYVTNPADLDNLNLSGVTYVELPETSPQSVWNSSKIRGTGILVVHNASGNAMMNNADGDFKGLIIADEIQHLHGTVLGGIIAFRNAFTGNVIGNGNAQILFSEEAVNLATGVVREALPLNVIAWYE